MYMHVLANISTPVSILTPDRLNIKCLNLVQKFIYVDTQKLWLKLKKNKIT